MASSDIPSFRKVSIKRGSSSETASNSRSSVRSASLWYETLARFPAAFSVDRNHASERSSQRRASSLSDSSRKRSPLYARFLRGNILVHREGRNRLDTEDEDSRDTSRETRSP